MSITRQAHEQHGDSVLDAQVASLLQRLERYREHRCREILELTESRAVELEREAWREAGARGRAAIAEARVHLDMGRHQTQAALDAALRQLAHAQARARLDELWRQLPASLDAQWRSTPDRGRWLRTALTLAAGTLVDSTWTIEHGNDLPRDEIARMTDELGLERRLALRFERRPDITAGVRIRCEGACIDATSAGLLAYASEIEAAFLAECDASGAPDACGILPERALG